MSMQMDADFAKEQTGTLFLSGGGTGRGLGGFGGGLSPRGVHPKKDTHKKHLPAHSHILEQQATNVIATHSATIPLSSTHKHTVTLS